MKILKQIPIVCLLVIIIYCVHIRTSKYEQIRSKTNTESSKKDKGDSYLVLAQPKGEKKCLTKSRKNGGVVVIVYSAPKNLEQRKWIRSTYGSEDTKRLTNIRVLFFLGFTSDLNLRSKIMDEIEKHDDIVRHYYPDSYYSMPMKAIAFMQWILKNCRPKVSYILKIDDDIVLDTFSLKNFISKQTFKVNRNKTLMCFHSKKTPVKRNPLSKFFVPFKILKENLYPDYCDGRCFIYHRSSILAILDAHSKGPIFPKIFIEDVLTTGYLRKMANVSIIDLPSLHNPRKLDKKLHRDNLNTFEVGTNQSLWFQVWGVIQSFHSKRNE